MCRCTELHPAGNRSAFAYKKLRINFTHMLDVVGRKFAGHFLTHDARSKRCPT